MKGSIYTHPNDHRAKAVEELINNGREHGVIGALGKLLTANDPQLCKVIASLVLEGSCQAVVVKYVNCITLVFYY